MQRIHLIKMMTGLALGVSLSNCGFPPVEQSQSLAECLPNSIKLTDIAERSSERKLTVEQRLDELKAVCNDQGDLIANSGKEVYFYKLTGCWGNAPSNYREILQRQQEEIQKLSQSYAVIEMTCNPSGIPIP